MAIAETLSTVERILTIGGPLIVTLMGDGNRDAAERVIDATSAALEYARMGLDGVDNYAQDLEEIATELEALQDVGGPGEAEFDATANRIADKTARLVDIATERKINKTS